MPPARQLTEAEARGAGGGGCMGRGRAGRGPRAQSGRRAVADAPPRKRGGELRGGEPDLPSPPRGGRTSGSRKAGGSPELELEPEPVRGELVRAARAGDAWRVKQMLSDGADPEESEGGGSGETALVAAAGGNPECAECRSASRSSCVRALIKGGACVDRPDDFGRTPLLAAAASGRAACVKALLDLGADEDLAGADGATALGVAAELGHSAVLRLLLQRGADVERTRGADGRTPLMAAADGGHEACVRLLITAGARPARKDASGRTARDLAQGKHTLCECLLEPTTAAQAVSRLAAAAAASKLGSRGVFSSLAALDLDGAPPRDSPARSGSSVGSTSPASATSAGWWACSSTTTPASAKPPRHPQCGPPGAAPAHER